MKNPLFFTFLLGIMFSTTTIFAQRVVEGKIMAENNRQAIPYAIIQVVEEGKFIYADEQGNFTITLSDETSKLLITSAGFVKREMIIPTQARKTICDISMKATSSTAKGVAKGKKGRDNNNSAVVKQ